MQMQTMPEPGLCLPTSFAMALDVPVHALLSQLRGWHDVVFPGNPEPLCWRGIHIQELIRLARFYGWAVTPFEMYPQIASPDPVAAHYIVTWSDQTNEAAFRDVILLSRGVITGTAIRAGIGHVGHAVAYDHGRVFDPNGHEDHYDLEVLANRYFYPQCAWQVDRVTPVAPGGAA